MKTFALIVLASTFAFAQKNDTPEFYLRTQKKKLAVVLKAAEFKPGDQIVDIGAGNGWFSSALGLHTDSLDFALEEIDSSGMNSGRITEMISLVTKARGRPVTNTYQWAIGNEKSTGLASGSYDKVLLIDTYHHMTFRTEMVHDIHRLLKPGGKLIVMEPVGRRDGELYKGCRTIILTPDAIVADFTAGGLRHEQTLKTVRSTRKRVRVFVFEKV